MANQTGPYLELVGRVLTSSRGAISRQREALIRAGDPDPDLTADTQTLVEFIDEVNAVSSAEIADPSTDVPLPEVPADLPIE